MKKFALVTLGLIALVGQLTVFIPKTEPASPAVEQCRADFDYCYDHA